jgi:hypothetical protein
MVLQRRMMHVHMMPVLIVGVRGGDGSVRQL